MGAWQEIVDYTFTANETSRTFTGFGTITKDDFVKVVVTHTNGSATNSDLRILAESSTNTNYHNQNLVGSDSSVGANRTNVNRMGRTNGSQTSSWLAYLKLSENDRLNVLSNGTLRNDSSLLNVFYYVTSSGATFASGITSLTFTAEQTNGLGTGSRIQIYKLAATKVADITVGSNTTQVDISNLSIDKDSEYLLVSDVLNAITNDNATVFIRVNDIASTYYNQLIYGLDSTAGAGRSTDSRYILMSANNRSLAYSHIKLSNIGAFTAQGYNIPDIGLSSAYIRNNFSSSVSEAITSITKINLVSAETNAIKAGSRFQLYKLY